MTIRDQTSRFISADQVEGTPVINAKGESLGHISDLMIDKSSGQVGYAVLKYASFLGLGGKLFPVPWDVLRYENGHHAYVVDIPEELLKTAPNFDSVELPDAAGGLGWDTQVRAHYGSRTSQNML